ncbi:MAG: hypothetical protein AAF394_08470, partial [Planctomycetota bacterium]
YYPSSYSCCPSLLQLALEMSANSNHPKAALEFISRHEETFINSLRGDFFCVYDLKRLKQFCKKLASLDLASVLRDILKQRNI